MCIRKEYPKGVDVVYECIGGEIFQTCLDNLAVKGRLIIIGFISGYEDEKGYIPIIVFDFFYVWDPPHSELV